MRESGFEQWTAEALDLWATCDQGGKRPLRAAALIDELAWFVDVQGVADAERERWQGLLRKARKRE